MTECFVTGVCTCTVFMSRSYSTSMVEILALVLQASPVIPQLRSLAVSAIVGAIRAGDGFTYGTRLALL